MATKSKSTSAPTERMYNLFIRPLVTEKTSKMGTWLSFVVAHDSTKPELKLAFERLYGVEVERVNTLIQKGKTKVAGGRHTVFRSDVKKAYIKLKDGQTVDLMAGVK